MVQRTNNVMSFASQHAHLINWYLNHCSVLYTAVSIALGNLVYLIVIGVIQRRQAGNLTSQIQLETIWTWIPVAYILVTTGTSLILLYGSEASNTTTSALSVTGSQWQWTADACIDAIPVMTQLAIDDRLAKEGTLRLATATQPIFANSQPTAVALTSLDVIHGWSIPSLGIRTDCIPGRTSVISVHAAVGTYAGFCSELCGVGHAFMPITLTVSEQAPSLTPLYTTGTPSGVLSSDDARDIISAANLLVSHPYLISVIVSIASFVSTALRFS